MDWTLGLWPLAKVALAFAAMLVGIRLRLGIWLSILAGGMVLALAFGLGPLDWAGAAAAGLFDRKALYLALIVWAIMALSGVMEKTGQTARLMEAMRGYLRSPRLGLVFFPSLIGLLPMPGGAVFSAPMVKSISEKLGLKPEDKVLVNYWFRHVWELGWPLYPGIILAASLAGIPLTRLVAYDLPGVALCLCLGWIFVLRPGRLVIIDVPDSAGSARNPGEVFRLGLPLFIAIIGAIGLEMAMSEALPGADFELGVLAALTAGLVTTLIQNRVPISELARHLFGGHPLKMILVIAAIFVFKETMARAGVVQELAGLAGGGAALFAAAVFLPFLVGFVSGITIAFVGATFPLLIGLVEQLGLTHQFMAYIVLGMFSGYAGVMASPIHICFVLTCEYFRVPLARAWRRVALPALLILAAGFAYFLILK